MRNILRESKPCNRPLSLLDILEHERNAEFIPQSQSQTKAWRNKFRVPSRSFGLVSPKQLLVLDVDMQKIVLETGLSAIF
jgi:hypothetical protein